MADQEFKYFAFIIANYVDVYGKPVGIVKLTESQRKGRNSSYMFEYRRVPIGEPGFYSWRVARVVAVNSALLPHEIVNTEYNTRYPIQEYKYYKKSGNVSQILFYNGSYEPCKSREGFARWVSSYNANGQKVKESYYDEYGKPCNNIYGYASVEIIYNDNGDVVSIVKYDEAELR